MIAIENKEIFEFKSSLSSLIEINNIKSIKLNDISIIKKIGEGGQSTVYLGKYNSEDVAVKILKQLEYISLMKEIVLLSNITHPLILKIDGIIDEDKTFGIVTQFIHGRNLSSIHITDISHQHKIKIVKDIADILRYLHINNFIHRDLKPDNLIINDKWKVHLIDFGIATICLNKQNSVEINKGTLNYLAPECFQIAGINDKEEALVRITTKVDIWSFGCLVSYLFSGIVPWENQCKNGIDIRTNLINRKPFPIPHNLEQHKLIYNIISKCTAIDINERASIFELMDYIIQLE